MPATALEQSTKNRAKGSNIVENLIKKRAKTPTRNLTKNRWKINQKSNQDQSKIDQESTKNQSKIELNSINIEKSLALRLGSRLGGLLEASWARLRGQHSPKLASQIEGKSIKNRCKNPSKN